MTVNTYHTQWSVTYRIIFHRGSESPSGHRRTAFPAIRSVLRYLARLRDEHRRRRSSRILESLPLNIRKDIGWPAMEDHA